MANSPNIFMSAVLIQMLTRVHYIPLHSHFWQVPPLIGVPQYPGLHSSQFAPVVKSLHGIEHVLPSKQVLWPEKCETNKQTDEQTINMIQQFK